MNVLSQECSSSQQQLLNLREVLSHEEIASSTKFQEQQSFVNQVILEKQQLQDALKRASLTASSTSTNPQLDIEQVVFDL